jgi:antitoxin component of RelBE/YafQ-DinJ toxin-antitoxin module
MSNTVTQPAQNKASIDIRVSVRVPQKLKSRVQRVARGLGIDESDVVRMALKHGLASIEQPQTQKVAA